MTAQAKEDLGRALALEPTNDLSLTNAACCAVRSYGTDSILAIAEAFSADKSGVFLLLLVLLSTLSISFPTLCSRHMQD